MSALVRLLILSDLHLEFATFQPPNPDLYDLVVLAGDIAVGVQAVHWAKRRKSTFAGKPVVLVPGNHEFYNSERTRMLTQAARGRGRHQRAPARPRRGDSARHPLPRRHAMDRLRTRCRPGHRCRASQAQRHDRSERLCGCHPRTTARSTEPAALHAGGRRTRAPAQPCLASAKTAGSESTQRSWPRSS